MSGQRMQCCSVFISCFSGRCWKCLATPFTVMQHVSSSKQRLGSNGAFPSPLFSLSSLQKNMLGFLKKKKRRRRRKYAYLLIESNLVLIVLNAIYLVLDLLLNFFFNFIPHKLIFISSLVIILWLLFVIFLSFSWLKLFFNSSPAIWFHFIFLSNLVFVLFNSILLVLDPFLVEFIFSISSLIIWLVWKLTLLFFRVCFL